MDIEELKRIWRKSDAEIYVGWHDDGQTWYAAIMFGFDYQSDLESLEGLGDTAEAAVADLMRQISEYEPKP